MGEDFGDNTLSAEWIPAEVAAGDEGGADKPSTDPGTLKVSIEELECYVYVRQ
jgi:hypothetical protein